MTEGMKMDNYQNTEQPQEKANQSAAMRQGTQLNVGYAAHTGSGGVGYCNGNSSGSGAGNLGGGGRVPTPEDEAQTILQKAKEHRSLAADQVLMLKMVIPALGAQLTILCEGITKWMRHQGFWISYAGKYDPQVARMEKSEKIALIHSEVSELLEGVRKGDYENEAEECADIAIRLFDYCGNYGINLALVIEAKMIKNYGRPYKHDKQF